MQVFSCKLMKNHRTRMFVTSLALLMLLLLLLSIYHYYEDRGLALRSIDERLYAGVTAARYVVGDGGVVIAAADQPLPLPYRRIAAKLQHLAAEMGLKDLYALAVADGAVRVALTSDARVYPPSAKYGDVGAEVLVKLKQPLYLSAGRDSHHRSIIIPCMASGGSRYWLGADIDSDLVDKALSANFQRALLQCVVLLILSIPLTALFVLPLACQLYTHELTGLPNRARLKKDLERWRLPQLMLIDVDGFKDINNYYGVRVGDQLLIRMSEIIKALIPAGTRLYKLDGDEFAVLSEASPQCISVDYLITRINEQRIEFEQTEFRLSVTAGVAQGTDQIIEHADLALKEAKRVLTPYKFYSSYLHTVQASRANLLWTYKLRDAIDCGRIVAYFQPIHNNRSAVVSHYEALVRLCEEDGTVVGPNFFMEAARRSRIYGRLTVFMLQAALRFIEENDVCCSVNLLNEDIVVEESRWQIIDHIRRAPGRKRLIFEIVESQGIDNYDVIRAFIEQVRTYGVRVAIDDFGTGYSNFDHISHLDIDYIKIDGSLIEQLGSSARSRTIVEAIIHFATELNIDTIAEYVSSAELQRIVCEMGIGYSQGYFIGKPLPGAVGCCDCDDNEKTVS